MCDPITLGLAVAASAGGAYLTGKDNLSTAQAEANARNGVLQGGINQLDNIYNTINKPAFGGAVGAVNAGNLAPAQDARTAAIQGNMAPAAAAPPGAGPAGAPPAVANANAKSLKNAFDFVHNQAAATGKLGGYNDQWFNSNLAKQDAARHIGIGNSFANEEKSLISPEQDLGAAAAYKPPGMAGQILSGVGGLLGANSGSSKPIGQGLGTAFSFPTANFSGGF